MLVFHHADSLKSIGDNGLNNISGFELLYPLQFHLKRRGTTNIWPPMLWLRAFFSAFEASIYKTKDLRKP